MEIKKWEKGIVIAILVLMMIVALTTMIYMIVKDVNQERKEVEETETQVEMEYILSCALNDIDMPNAEHCALIEIMHDKAYKEFILVIENEGVFVVGVNYENGVARYVDVVKQIY